MGSSASISELLAKELSQTQSYMHVHTRAWFNAMLRLFLTLLAHESFLSPLGIFRYYHNG